jgi:RimJ/RimL family protein N-acetyltransferase
MQIPSINKQITLEDGFIKLIRFDLVEVNEVYLAVRESLEDLLPWMPWCHNQYIIEDTRQYLESREEAWSKGKEYDFAIIDSRDNTFIGACGFNDINYEEKRANLGYWIRTSKTGQGIATLVVRLLALFAFEKLNLNRAELIIATDNKNSQRVAEKSGAVKEGILRNRLVVRDQIQDAVMYSLIPDDLKKESS